MSRAEFMVASKCASAHVKKLRVWEVNHPDHTGPLSPQAGVAVAPCATGTVSLQDANAAPCSVPEKSTVILSRTVGVVGSFTDTLPLTVHDTTALQSEWNRSSCTWVTMAPGSTAPRSARTSACKAVKTGPTVADVSGVTSKE